MFFAISIAIGAILIGVVMFGRRRPRSSPSHKVIKTRQRPSGDTVVLRNEKTTTDSRYLSARLTEEGDVVFEGHDLGDAVENFFGEREYEWSWTVKALNVPKLAAALGTPGDILSAIRDRFSHERANEIEPFLNQHSIPYETWSRIGD
jgi:hypothetical protein